MKTQVIHRATDEYVQELEKSIAESKKELAAIQATMPELFTPEGIATAYRLAKDKHAAAWCEEKAHRFAGTPISGAAAPPGMVGHAAQHPFIVIMVMAITFAGLAGAALGVAAGADGPPEA